MDVLLNAGIIQLRAVLPSQITSEELGVLDILRLADKRPSDMTLTLEALRADVKSLDSKLRCVFAEKNDIVGWATAESYYFNSKGDVLLLNVFVRSDFRGRGIGRSLAVEVDKLAHEISSLPPWFNQEHGGFFRHVLPWHFRAA